MSDEPCVRCLHLYADHASGRCVAVAIEEGGQETPCWCRSFGSDRVRYLRDNFAPDELRGALALIEEPCEHLSVRPGDTHCGACGVKVEPEWCRSCLPEDDR